MLCPPLPAIRFRANTRIGFVATNSITQGEQVAQLWPLLFHRYGLEIAFAHSTFAWGSDARGMAHVHVVILGLTRLYDRLTMPPVLCKAHTALDAAVDSLYRPQSFTDDREHAEQLLTRYEVLSAPRLAAAQQKPNAQEPGSNICPGFRRRKTLQEVK